MASEATGDRTIFREFRVLLVTMETQAATDIYNTSSHSVKGCGRHIETAKRIGIIR